ncbi:hypothetical protein ACFFRR_004349 [Megaselia abdita]
MLTIGYVFSAILAGLVILFLAFLGILRTNPERIFNVYPKKGLLYHLKYYLVLQLVKHFRERICQKYIRRNSIDYIGGIYTMDAPQELGQNPKSYDKVSFTGATQNGYRLVVSMERRRRGIYFAALYLYTPNRGVFKLPNLPDTICVPEIEVEQESNNNEFHSNGIKIEVVNPMRKWKIEFNGNLTNGDKVYNVAIKAEFNSKNSSYFNHNKDLSSFVIADSLAREPWNDDFFHILKNIGELTKNREHYEQVGTMEVDFKIDEEQEISVTMQAFRDHSFGTDNDLETMHRYAYFIIFLNNGSYVVFGNLSRPSFFLSSLKVGYVVTKDGRYVPLKGSNFELYSYGESGRPPKHSNFVISTEDNNNFISIVCEDSEKRYVGVNWEAKIYNQFISCGVGSQIGHGVAEYFYQNATGRPESAQQKDPGWFKSLRNYERTISECQHTEDEEDDDDFGF